ncbi:MAG TPA: glycosyltransferase family 2 protein [Verrucomicrobiae bacterium]|nr:glycosyltransferase family 2 protein [Verrucomicrobiae bacterium]
MSPITELPADPNIEPKKYSSFWFRFFEILPGATVWIALISPFILAVYAPLAVTIFILLFDVYWFLRAISYGGVLVKGYRQFHKNVRTDWGAKLAQITALTPEQRDKWHILPWEDVYHAVIVTTYKEELTILKKSLDSIVEADYPKDRMIVVLATEQRAGEHAQEIIRVLSERYKGKFGKFLISEHPDDIVGEVKAKGANATWAAKILVEEMHKSKIPLSNVIVSTADADTRFPAFYFSCLTYNFCVTPDRVRASFQPIATFFNNIWQAPMLSRVLAFNTTFWALGESVRNYRLLTFSTHATCLQTLVDIDYWCTSIVNEDSRQFFRSYFHYKGNFRVVPLFIPIYMDAVHVQKMRDTLRNLYYQQQRWAYGVEHFPYIVLESHRLRRSISLGRRVMLIWRAFDGAFSWATTSFFITVVGWLPILLNEQFSSQVASSNFPQAAKLLLSLTWIGLVISGIITLLLLPPDPKRKSPLSWAGMILQWAFIPIAAIFFGALPGLDAQTRLMFGKYIGFRVTEKKAV